jgi:hypothetical protein
LKPDARTTTIAQELGIDDAEIARRKSFLEFTDVCTQLLRIFPGLPAREHVQQTLLLQQYQTDFERADRFSGDFISRNLLCTPLMALKSFCNMILSNLNRRCLVSLFLRLHCSLHSIRQFTTLTGS